MIRIATAHAKARLSNIVKEEDAEAAIHILQFALFKEAPKKKSRSKRARLDHSMNGESDSEDSDDDDSTDPKQSTNSQRRPSAQASVNKGKNPVRSATQNEDVEMMDIDEEEEEALTATRRASRRQPGSSTQGSSSSSLRPYVPGGEVHPSRQELFQNKTSQSIMNVDEGVEFEELLAAVNKDLPIEQLFGPSEATAILNKMEVDNKIMFSGGVIYRI